MSVQTPIRESIKLPAITTPALGTSFSIVDYLPLKLVLYLAAPYLAGDSGEEAIKTAQRIFERDHFSGTIDVLGEDATDTKTCETYVNIFTHLISGIVANRLSTTNPQEQITVSMKPSMFSACPPGEDLASKRELEEAFNRIARVADYAFRRNVRLTLEAEDYRWTDFQLKSYFALINAGYKNVGTVLQSRLFRTAQDLEKFDERMRVRLVIGIYQESASIAYTDKAEMKEKLLQYAGQLLAKGVYVELATHDTHCVENFFKDIVVPHKIPTNKFETQFLLGVPRAKLQRDLISGKYFQTLSGHWNETEKKYLEGLSKSGTIVRLYLPFGKDNIAGPYCKRRLKRNPNLLLYGIKNLLGWE